MSTGSVLRPESTLAHSTWRNKLIGKGYYPATALPAFALLRVRTEKGPAVFWNGLAPSKGGLPKIKGGLDGDGPTHSGVSVGGTIVWCPVVYHVLWKTLSCRGCSTSSSTVLSAEISRINGNRGLQVGVLGNYLVAYIAVDPSRDWLRPAIDAALGILERGGLNE